MENLSQKLSEQQVRCYELLGQYNAIGASGIFGATMIKASLHKAKEAVESNNTEQMFSCYQNLKNLN